jgi:hypothetical protein
MTDENDDRGDKKYYKNGEWHDSQEGYERREKERIIKEHFPQPDPYCDCGAKHDRDFPNIHSRWCRAYRETR